MGQGTKHLCEDVIAEILLSMSIKSLLRFKSVSKSWRSLISCAKFAEDHLNRSNSDPDFTHHMLIAKVYDSKSGTLLRKPGTSVRSCSLNSLLTVEPNRNDLVPTWVHHYTNLSSVKIHGSCNGLILITTNECSLSIWNPSTRKLKDIPQPRGECSGPMLWDYVEYGFGYDDSTDNYKVVSVISRLGRDCREVYQTRIYTVRTDSWKKIGGTCVKGFSPDYSGKFVSGKLHWLRRKEKDIVSLALVEGEEKYQVMASRECFSNYHVPRLENLGGYLSFIGHLIDDEDLNIWVMMNYGLVESWTKICTISWSRILSWSRKPKPFWVTKDRDIFVAFSKSVTRKLCIFDFFGISEEVVVYNGTSKLRDYLICEDELRDQMSFYWSRDHNEPVVYVESLISP